MSWNVDQGKYSQAEEYYNQAKAIREKTFGDKHPDIGESFAQLAYVYAPAQRPHPRLKGPTSTPSSIYKNSIGEKHPSYAKTMANLGIALRTKKKDNNNAEKYLTQALATREKNPAARPSGSEFKHQPISRLLPRQRLSQAKAEPLYRQDF